jgi:hypothetical protein
MSRLERDLIEKSDHLLKTSIIIAIILFVVIILFLAGIYQGMKNQRMIDSSQLGYYLRCESDKQCKNYGECERVTIKTEENKTYNDYLCLKETSIETS